jgi:hypothetical protein
MTILPKGAIDVVPTIPILRHYTSTTSPGSRKQRRLGEQMRQVTAHMNRDHERAMNSLSDLILVLIT